MLTHNDKSRLDSYFYMTTKNMLINKVIILKPCKSSISIGGVCIPLFLKISINSYRKELMSWRISITSSSETPYWSRVRCSAVINLRTRRKITAS